MTLKRRELQAYTKKLYRFLKQGHTIQLKKTKGYVGEIYYPNGDNDPIVNLDYRRDIISTLIHEHLHHVNPEWCESKILRHESIIINALSERQVRNIIKAFAEAI
jgi:hypothetical protein